jgi:hypothetical protein
VLFGIKLETAELVETPCLQEIPTSGAVWNSFAIFLLFSFQVLSTFAGQMGQGGTCQPALFLASRFYFSSGSGTTTGVTNFAASFQEEQKMKISFKTLAAFATVVAALTPALAQKSEVQFNLAPEKKFQDCFSKHDGYDPLAQVTVQRGSLNDVLILHAEHMKPNTGFDMFTVQNSNLLSDGTPDPNFKNFGLAWYQSDIETDSNGTADVTIKTILLDQIFGFDPVVGLSPTNTFHVGFWFNNPQDAAACGFDPSKPTPFNGEHRAGPAAMISVPNATTKLGPLCTQPVELGVNGPFACNP